MRRDIQQLVDTSVKVEAKILDELAKLPSWAAECRCDDCTVWNYLNENGEWPEIEAFCLNCGGYVPEREGL